MLSLCDPVQDYKPIIFMVMAPGLYFAKLCIYTGHRVQSVCHPGGVQITINHYNATRRSVQPLKTETIILSFAVIKTGFCCIYCFLFIDLLIILQPFRFILRTFGRDTQVGKHCLILWFTLFILKWTFFFIEGTFKAKEQRADSAPLPVFHTCLLHDLRAEFPVDLSGLQSRVEAECTPYQSNHCDLCSLDKAHIHDRRNPSVSQSLCCSAALYKDYIFWIPRTVEGAGRRGWEKERTARERKRLAAAWKKDKTGQTGFLVFLYQAAHTKLKKIK